MNVISDELSAHYASGTTTLAQCWKCTRADGQIFGYTSLDQDIIFDEVTYLASSGFTPSNIQSNANLSVSNLEVVGILDSENITEEDLTAGLWDGCAIEIFEVNFRDLTMGKRILGGGTIGNITSGRQSFSAELRGLTQRVQQSIGELYSPTCRAELGDARCGVNLSSYEVSGTITQVDTNQKFYDSARTEASSWFARGKITFTSGENTGLSMEVKSFADTASGVIKLQMPMPYPVQVGDTYTMLPGCMKRHIDDCKNKYNNIINFRGEPYVPGNDQMMQVGGI